MNEPPDQTAVFSAANLLSPTGMTVPKYSRKSSGCSLSAGVGVEEDHALALELLVDLVVDHLGLVLSRHTRHQPCLLRLGDAQLVVGVLDVGRQVVPGRGLLLGGADEVLDVVEVDVVELGAPGRHRLAAEELVALQPQVEHPLRLALQPGDVGDDLRGQATLRRRAGNIGIGPAPLVATEGGQMLILGLAGADRSSDSGILGLGHDRCPFGCGHIGRCPAPRWCGHVRNMGRAHTVAMRDGGQPLHMYPKQPGERSSLHLAELGKSLGDMGHRAVVLTELLTDRRRQCRCDVAILGQGSGESLHRRAVWCRVRDPLLVALLALGDPRLCEPRDRFRAGRGRRGTQGLDGQVVVGGVEH